MKLPRIEQEFRYHAQELVRWVVDHAEAPEGIEFFEWYWVPGEWREFNCPIAELSMSVMADACNPEAVCDIVRIKPKALRWTVCVQEVELEGAIGFDTYHRIAVLFFARGGKMERVA